MDEQSSNVADDLLKILSNALFLCAIKYQLELDICKTSSAFMNIERIKRSSRELLRFVSFYSRVFSFTCSWCVGNAHAKDETINVRMPHPFVLLQINPTEVMYAFTVCFVVHSC